MKTKNRYINRWNFFIVFFWPFVFYYIVENIVFTILYGFHCHAVTQTEKYFDYFGSFLLLCAAVPFLWILFDIVAMFAYADSIQTTKEIIEKEEE